MPRFDFPAYSAVVTAPLEAADFEPDILLLYGSAAVMTQIMLAKNWLDGEDVLSRYDRPRGLRLLRCTGPQGAEMVHEYPVRWRFEENWL